MPSTTDEELLAYYAARADEYDDVSLHPPASASDHAQIRYAIPRQFGGRRVLDVACGTGSWTALIAAHADEVVGVDINSSVLDIARRRSELAQARLQIADAYDLGDELGLFDAAFVGFWASHVPRRRMPVFLASLHRRLVPGALVVMVDDTETHCRTTPIAAQDTHGDTFQTRRLVDGSAFRVLKNFPTEAELKAATAPFGRHLSYLELEYYWVLAYESGAWGTAS